MVPVCGVPAGVEHFCAGYAVKRRVYLSGGMEYATGEGRDWREAAQGWLEGEFGWEVFNPNRESDRVLGELCGGEDFREMKRGNPERYRAIVTRLVELDCGEIAQRTDILVCYWDDGAMHGAGTKGELTMAKHYRKPVYLVTSIPLVDIPGWVLGCTTEIFGSFDELRSFLRSHPSSA